jgi:hypothetical protein
MTNVRDFRFHPTAPGQPFRFHPKYELPSVLPDLRGETYPLSTVMTWDESGSPVCQLELNDTTTLKNFLDDRFRPSRSIPPKVYEKIPEALLLIYDYLYWRTTIPLYSLKDVTDPDRCPDALLEYQAYERGLIVPYFIKRRGLVQLIKDSKYINQYRNTLAGLNRYLQDVLQDTDVTATLAQSTVNGRVLWLSAYGHGIPNYSKNPSFPEINFLFHPNLFLRDVTVTLSGRVTSDLVTFVNSVSGSFVPMIDSGYYRVYTPVVGLESVPVDSGAPVVSVVSITDSAPESYSS